MHAPTTCDGVPCACETSWAYVEASNSGLRPAPCVTPAHFNSVHAGTDQLAHLEQVAAWMNNTRTRSQQGGRLPGARLQRNIPVGSPAVDHLLTAQPAAQPADHASAAGINGVSSGIQAVQDATWSLINGSVHAQRHDDTMLPSGTVAPLAAAPPTPGPCGSGLVGLQHEQQQQAFPQPQYLPQPARPSHSQTPGQAATFLQPPHAPSWEHGTLRTGRPYLGAMPYAAPYNGPQKRRRGALRTAFLHAAHGGGASAVPAPSVLLSYPAISSRNRKPRCSPVSQQPLCDSAQ